MRSNKVAVFLSSGLPSSSGGVCVCVYVCVNPGLVVDWKINRCCLHRPSQMESVTRVSLFLSLLSSSFSMEVCVSLPFTLERSLICFSRCVSVYQYKGSRGFQQVSIDYMLGFPSLLSRMRTCEWSSTQYGGLWENVRRDVHLGGACVCVIPGQRFCCFLLYLLCSIVVADHDFQLN